MPKRHLIIAVVRAAAKERALGGAAAPVRDKREGVSAVRGLAANSDRAAAFGAARGAESFQQQGCFAEFRERGFEEFQFQHWGPEPHDQLQAEGFECDEWGCLE